MSGATAFKRLLKILHEVGTVGLMGAIATELVLLGTAAGRPPAEYAALRQGIHDVARWVLVPSMGLTLFTGFLAMAIHRPFHNAAWAWVKALLGVSVMEATLFGVSGNAKQVAELSAQVAAGTADARGLASLLRHEWGVLWVLLFISLVNIVLGVWRPKLFRGLRRESEAPAPAAPTPSSDERG